MQRPKWQIGLFFMAGGIVLIILLIVAIYSIIILTEFMVEHYVVSLSLIGIGIIGLVGYKLRKSWLEREGYNEI